MAVEKVSATHLRSLDGSAEITAEETIRRIQDLEYAIGLLKEDLRKGTTQGKFIELGYLT